MPSVRLVILTAILCASATAAPSGRLVGTVQDPSGAPVSGAKFVLVSIASAHTRTGVADIHGAFGAPGLAPGLWTLTVEAAGFKRYRVDSIAVTIDRTTHADVQLELGERSETIDVRASGVPIERSQANPVSVTGRAAIPNLPLNGRQFLDLAVTAPGIVPAAPGTQGNGFSSAGMRSQSNVYLLDGVSNIDTQTNQPLNLFRLTEADQDRS